MMLVALHVPVGVVELLEVVDVEHDEAERRLVAPGALHLLLEGLLEEVVRVQAGHAVGGGLAEEVRVLDGDGREARDARDVLDLREAGTASPVFPSTSAPITPLSVRSGTIMPPASASSAATKDRVGDSSRGSTGRSPGCTRPSRGRRASAVIGGSTGGVSSSWTPAVAHDPGRRILGRRRASRNVTDSHWNLDAKLHATFFAMFSTSSCAVIWKAISMISFRSWFSRSSGTSCSSSTSPPLISGKYRAAPRDCQASRRRPVSGVESRDPSGTTPAPTPASGRSASTCAACARRCRRWR